MFVVGTEPDDDEQEEDDDSGQWLEEDGDDGFEDEDEADTDALRDGGPRAAIDTGHVDW